MKAVRRFGFILLVLFVGIMIGHTSLTFSFFVVTPLFITWLILWDSKKFESDQKKYYEELNEHYHYE